MAIGQNKSASGRRRWRFWLGLALAGAVMLFTLQNVSEAEVAFLFWAVRMPLAILLFVIFAMGAVAGWLLSRSRRPG